MNGFLKTIIAGYGAKKLGGGCISTILIFIVIYWALGNFGNCNSNRSAPARPASITKEKKIASSLEVGTLQHTTAIYQIK